MSVVDLNLWLAENQRSLMAELCLVREALKHHVARVQKSAGHEPSLNPSPTDIGSVSTLSPPSALDVVCSTFALSPFERKLLLLCASVELDSSFASLCAAAQGDPHRPYPTFSLALAALPDPNWCAIAPAGPLRHWRLIEVGAGGPLTLSPLRIDERVLHYLTGVQHLDERLIGIVQPARVAAELVPSHEVLVNRLVRVWNQVASRSHVPIVQLWGQDTAGKKAVAAAACAAIGLQLHAIHSQALPLTSTELFALIRLWEREAALNASALLVDSDDLDRNDAARVSALTQLLESTRGAICLISRELWRPIQRRVFTFEVRRPAPHEQRLVWQRALGGAVSGVNGQFEALVSQFSLSAAAIRAAAAEALERLQSENARSGNPTADLGAVLWQVCRGQTGPHLRDLAQPLETTARWEDLILPETQLHILQEIAVHVRQRATVYEKWGFAAKSARGLGISALFVGPSGTGKTMAAEVLANELRLDLYRIDLSQVVSKYIGETEKNLRRVFDAAEEGGGILLFDEADALFGKRSEVKDSHDRYANIEVSYLLQRMEAYRGLAILTTNLKEAVDHAFLRRIRFVVHFPFPDAAQRAAIWRRIFPPSTPTERLNVDRLAELNIAGGNIRNIALYAAFLAADAREPVRMSHLLRAARVEYGKLEKPLTEAEIGGWV